MGEVRLEDGEWKTSDWNIYTPWNQKLAPENGWLEDYTYYSYLLGWPMFRGYVSFRDGIYPKPT